MAIYLKINKIGEDDHAVRYEFDSGINGCKDLGILEINRKSGDCVIVQEMIGDTNNELAGYAYRAILKHWKKGEFPDKTCWAS